ncbi:MAG: hypothetical protein ACRC1G_08455 [Bradyrhizobium sp.]|nr:hypothetical protein [Bradyrhizobium sp.]
MHVKREGDRALADFVRHRVHAGFVLVGAATAAPSRARISVPGGLRRKPRQ